jgi:hypothetical protein
MKPLEKFKTETQTPPSIPKVRAAEGEDSKGSRKDSVRGFILAAKLLSNR